MATSTLNIGTGYGSQLTGSEIVARALELAGLKNPAQSVTDPARVGQGFDFLRLEMSSLQAEGVILSATAWGTLTLTADENQYSAAAQGATAAAGELPGDLLDVLGTLMVSTDSTSTVKTPVEPMTADEWATLTDVNTVVARPTRYYVQRSFPIGLYLWPTPDADYTLTYRYSRLIKDIGSGNTPDLAAYWHFYLVYALASHLGRSAGLSLDTVTDLSNQAAVYKDKARRFNRPHGPVQIYSLHRGPWS